MLETGSLFWQIFSYINVFILAYFLAINLSYLSLTIVSFFYIRKHYKTMGVHEFTGIFESSLYKSFSIIVPAYNEEKLIVETIQSMLQQRFGDFEVIVVNDGSTDDTLTRLKDTFELFSSSRHISDRLKHEPIKSIYLSRSLPNLVVIDKENGQRADAVNAGLNTARKDLFCTIDADCKLDRNVLLKMLRAFAKDENTVAVGGILRLSNGCVFEKGELKQIHTPRSFIACIQALEYIRAFLSGRTGWASINGLLIISGAFGVFDRKAVLKAGGYYTNALAEDFELIATLHKYYMKHNIPYNVTFQPEPVCWTEVPETWSDLSSQRNRWQRGLLQTLWCHKDMTFNPRYGSIGMVAMPFHIVFELLGPMIELFGYIAIAVLLVLGILPPVTGLLFFIVAIFFGFLLSVTSLYCDELTYQQYPRFKDLMKLILVSIFESFGYRQLHTWWRCKGMAEYLFGNMVWNKKRRNPKLINTYYWISFILINVLILYLAYYGITNGGISL